MGNDSHDEIIQLTEKGQLPGQRYSCERCDESTATTLTISANQQRMPIRSIQAEHVQRCFAFCGIDDLSDPEQWFVARNLQEIRGRRSGGSCIHLLIGISDFNP